MSLLSDVVRTSDEDLQKQAEHIRHELAMGVKKPYKEVMDVSSADAHRTGMVPITFVRQVLATCIYPDLLRDDTLPVDVRQRAERMLKHCDGSSVGAYSDSWGLECVRVSVADFISRRDGGVATDQKNIFISTGSCRGIMIMLKLLAWRSGQAQPAVMIPEPHPHTLPRLLQGIGLVALPYRLQEKKGWTLETEELQRAIHASRGRCNPRAIYISNPGDPTGHIQDRKTIEEVIRFAAEENLLLLVDEVYQDCVFGQGCEFLSYKRVLFEMGLIYSGSVKMASFNSLSNGTLGECGLRAGYMELVNFDDDLLSYVEVLLTGDISPPVIGQIGLDLLADPPRPGEPSHSRYMQELLSCKNTVKQNLERGRTFLNLMSGFCCLPVMGGVYLYTHLTLPQVIGMSAGPLYCEKLLEEEGVCVGLSECVCDDHSDTGNCFYIRICVLMPPHKLEDLLCRLGSFHLRFLQLPTQITSTVFSQT